MVNVIGKIEGNILLFLLCVNNKSYVFLIFKEKICLKIGWRVCLFIENGVINMTVMQFLLDDLNNYVRNFIQWYYVVFNFKDIIKEGDIYCMNVILKMMIFFFYSYSVLFKYFVECIDYIFKIEVMFFLRFLMCVWLLLYVNLKGGKGKNKVVDMEKENEVRVLKDLIRGLGVNKIEYVIVIILKVVLVISEIVVNFGSSLKIKERGISYKKRDDKGDLIIFVNVLKQKNIWNYVFGREFLNKVFEILFKFDKNMFKYSVLIIVNCFKFGILVLDLDEEEVEGDDVDDEQ